MASIPTADRKVVIVGQGYVGLPLAMLAVEAGYSVVGLDTDRLRIEQLRSGHSFIEDVSSATVHAALETGRYQPTVDVDACRGFSVAAITVPTPLKDGIPDLSYVTAAATMLANALVRGATVILESTTYPGTTEEVVGPILEAGSGLTAGRDFSVGFQPRASRSRQHCLEYQDDAQDRFGYRRFIAPGGAGLLRHAGGHNRARLGHARSRARQTARKHVPPGKYRSCQRDRHLRPRSRNRCVGSYRSCLHQTVRLYAIRAGPRGRGHCLPIDPSYLSWQVRLRLGESFRFVELANDINEHMPSYVTLRLTAGLNLRQRSINGSNILLLGLTYKKNTSDVRQSPAMRVAALLLGLGATVRAADPHLVQGQCPTGVELVKFTAGELAASDAVILLVDHDEFADPIVLEHAVRTSSILATNCRVGVSNTYDSRRILASPLGTPPTAHRRSRHRRQRMRVRRGTVGCISDCAPPEPAGRQIPLQPRDAQASTGGAHHRPPFEDARKASDSPIDEQ